MAKRSHDKSGLAYSIAEARDNLSALVRQAESEDPIELTRHGKSVAVLLAKKTFDRLTAPERFADALRRLRMKQDMRALDITRDTFAGLRSNEVGRDTNL
ncbi:MAG: type II toxin-antitoxin system prevent-host-death family antitoxin [Candidatus Cybelea sp.]